jgi:hypothetical protein
MNLNVGTDQGEPIPLTSPDDMYIIASGDFTNVSIQMRTAAGSWVLIKDGEFNSPECRLLRGIASGAEIRSVVTGGTSSTVELIGPSGPIPPAGKVFIVVDGEFILIDDDVVEVQ